jgi:Na+-translocating ferredoxin:NAD+ oxidoreductase subunit E
MARAEAFASRHAPWPALLDGFAIGAGFAAVLLLLGIARETLGAGTLFAGAGALLGLPWLEVSFAAHWRGLLLAGLPPGAFLLLALLLALQQRLRRGRDSR